GRRPKESSLGNRCQVNLTPTRRGAEGAPPDPPGTALPHADGQRASHLESFHSAPPRRHRAGVRRAKYLDSNASANTPGRPARSARSPNAPARSTTAIAMLPSLYRPVPGSFPRTEVSPNSVLRPSGRRSSGFAIDDPLVSGEHFASVQ